MEMTSEEKKEKEAYKITCCAECPYVPQARRYSKYRLHSSPAESNWRFVTGLGWAALRPQETSIPRLSLPSDGEDSHFRAVPLLFIIICKDFHWFLQKPLADAAPAAPGAQTAEVGNCEKVHHCLRALREVMWLWPTPTTR